MKSSSHNTGRKLTTKGFSLLEVLVATSAMAVLLAAIYTVFFGATSLRDRSAERIEATRVRARAVNLLRSDLRNAIVAGGVLAGTLIGDAKGPDGRHPGYLRLTTTSARLDDATTGSDIQDVEYFVVDDPVDETRQAGVLVRTCDRHLLAVNPEEPNRELLLHGVEALEFSFLSEGQWIDAWDADHTTNAPPQSILVSIQFAEDEDRQVAPSPIELVVPVVMQPLSTEDEETQEGGGNA